MVATSSEPSQETSDKRSGSTSKTPLSTATSTTDMNQMTTMFEKLSVRQQSEFLSQLQTTDSVLRADKSSQKVTSEVMKDRKYTSTFLKEFAVTHSLGLHSHYSMAKGHQELLKITAASLPEVHRLLVSDIPEKIPSSWIIDPLVTLAGHSHYYQLLSTTVKVWLLNDIIPVNAVNTWNTTNYTPFQLLEEVVAREDILTSYERLLTVWMDDSMVRQLPRFTDRMLYLQELAVEFKSAFKEPFDGVMLLKIFQLLQDFPHLKQEILPKFRSLLANNESVTPKAFINLVRANHWDELISHTSYHMVNSVQTKSDAPLTTKGSFFKLLPEANTEGFSFAAKTSSSSKDGTNIDGELKQVLTTIAKLPTQEGDYCRECHYYAHPRNQHLFPHSLRASALGSQFTKKKWTTPKSDTRSNSTNANSSAYFPVVTLTTSSSTSSSTSTTLTVPEQVTIRAQALYDSGATICVMSARFREYSQGSGQYNIQLQFGNNTNYTCHDLHLVEISLLSGARLVVPVVFIPPQLISHEAILSVKALTKDRIKLVFDTNYVYHKGQALTTAPDQYIGEISIHRAPNRHFLASLTLSVAEMLNTDSLSPSEGPTTEDPAILPTSSAGAIHYTQTDVQALIHTHFSPTVLDLLELDDTDTSAPQQIRFDSAIPSLVEVTPLQVLILHIVTGHLSTNRLEALGYHVPPKCKRLLQQCKTCATLKMKSIPRSHKDNPVTWTNEVLQIIHADLTGHYVDSQTGIKLFVLVVIDDYTRFSDIRVVRNKSLVADALHAILEQWSTYHNRSIGLIKVDNGSEFQKLATQYGYQILPHPSYTPAHNGVAERNLGLHKLLVSLLLSGFTGLSYQILFPFANQYATTLQNRGIHPTIGDTTRVELFLGRRIKARTFPLFGCDVELEYKQTKVSGIMVGYDVFAGVYRFLLIQFPLLVVVSAKFQFLMSTSNVKVLAAIIQRQTSTPIQMCHPAIYGPTRTPVTQQLFSSTVEHSTLPSSVPVFTVLDEMTSDLPVDKATLAPWVSQLNQICAIKCVPVKIKLCADSNFSTSTTSSSTATECCSVVQEIVTDPEVHFTPHLILDVPKSYHAAKKIPLFAKAITVESNQFQTHQVMVGIDQVPLGIQLLHGFWLFTSKFDPYINDFKAKARFVILGNHEAVDDFPTSSPTLNMITFRVFLTLVLANNWELKSSDITTAFLYGELDRPVFLKTPPGFGYIKEPFVKITKSTYGLRDSPYNFFIKLVEVLQQFSLGPAEKFIQNPHDQCSFSFIHEGSLLGMVIFYVDDLLYAGTSSFLDRFGAHLLDNFTIKTTTFPSTFLGCTFQYLPHSICLSQKPFIESMVTKLQLEECVTRTTDLPAPSVIPQAWYKDQLDQVQVPAQTIQTLLGVLLWLSTRTFPHISYLVSSYSRLPHNGITLQLLKWLIRYVYTHREDGFWFYGSTESQLDTPTNLSSTIQLFTDASLMGRTHMGYVVYLSGNVIHWKSSVMPTYSSGSTVDAEFASLHGATKYYLHIIGLIYSIYDYSHLIDYPFDVFIDNQPLLSKLHGFKQVIDIPTRLPKVQEFRSWVLLQKWLSLKKVAGGVNPADIFTKHFAKPKLVEALPYLNFGSSSSGPAIFSLLNTLQS